MKDLLVVLRGTKAELGSPRAKKVLAVAKYASVHAVTEILRAEELVGRQHDVSSSNPSPKSLLLSIGSDCYITMTNSMIRMIASMSPANELLGRNDVEAAQVDSWLSFLWHSIELPLHVLREMGSLTSSEGKGETTEGSVQLQLKSAVTTIEAHLAKKMKQQQSSLEHISYFVGESITLADISIAVYSCYLMPLVESDSILNRWLGKIEKECKLDTMT